MKTVSFVPVIEVLLNDDLTIADYRIHWEDSYVGSWDNKRDCFIKGIDESDISGNARTFLSALGIDGYPKDETFVGWEYLFGYKEKSNEPF